MKSKEEIKSRIDRPMKWGEQYISALVWVLDNEGSAMREADSNAMLGDVRAEINKLKFKSDIIEKSEKVGEGQLLINYNKGLMDALEIFNKKISEHFR